MRQWYRYSAAPRVRSMLHKAAMDIAWLMPRWLVYWCVVRAAVLAAGNDKRPTSVTSTDMLKSME